MMTNVQPNSHPDVAAYALRSETLTVRNIVDAYQSAYYSVYKKHPGECRFYQGRWFIIDGVERDRHWVILEIERLRQEALTRALDDEEHDTTSSRGRIFRLLRKLSRI